MNTLQEAIGGISPERLRRIFIQICKENAECKKSAESLLLFNVNAASGLKRKRDNEVISVPRFQVCTQCNEELDISENEESSCVYHDGEKEMDDDSPVWCDYEDWRQGPLDEKIDDPEYAEGYVWTCCGRLGDEKGCKTSAHSFKSSGNMTWNDADSTVGKTHLHPAKHQRVESDLSTSAPLAMGSEVTHGTKQASRKASIIALLNPPDGEERPDDEAEGEEESM